MATISPQNVTRFSWSGSGRNHCGIAGEHAPHLEGSYGTPRDGCQSNYCRGQSGPNIHIGIEGHRAGSPYSPGSDTFLVWEGYVDPGPFLFRAKVWPEKRHTEGRRLRGYMLLTDIEQVDGPRKAARSWVEMPLHASLIPSGTEITLKAGWEVHYARKAGEWREGIGSRGVACGHTAWPEILAPWDKERNVRVAARVEAALMSLPDSPCAVGIHARPDLGEQELIAMLHRFCDSSGVARPDTSSFGEVA